VSEVSSLASSAAPTALYVTRPLVRIATDRSVQVLVGHIRVSHGDSTTEVLRPSHDSS
jgi:hypothetical protein